MSDRSWDLTEGIEDEESIPSAAVWQPHPSGMITPHYSWLEAACNHCGRVTSLESVQKTAEWMERVRSGPLEGRRVMISSWCRCPEWNAQVGGALLSFHMKGMACDIVADGLTPTQTHSRLLRVQGAGKMVQGLGRYASFTHLDRGSPRRWNGP